VMAFANASHPLHRSTAQLFHRGRDQKAQRIETITSPQKL
jgi:hypothetical protein